MSYFWYCRICHDQKTTPEHPNVPVCDKCVEPVAAYLCKEELNVDMNVRGVDREYWMDQARFLMALAVKRWVPLGQRDLEEATRQRSEVVRLGGTLDRT